MHVSGILLSETILCGDCTNSSSPMERRVHKDSVDRDMSLTRTVLAALPTGSAVVLPWLAATLLRPKLRTCTLALRKVLRRFLEASADLVGATNHRYADSLHPIPVPNALAPPPKDPC